MCKRAGDIPAGFKWLCHGVDGKQADRLVIEQPVKKNNNKKEASSRRKERQTEDEYTCPKREKGRLQPLQSMKAVRG